MSLQARLKDREISCNFTEILSIFTEVLCLFRDCVDSNHAAETLALWSLKFRGLQLTDLEKADLVSSHWPEQLDELLILIVDKWVNGDPSYRMALKRALHNLLLIRLEIVGFNSKFELFIQHILNYSQSDLRISYGVLEAVAKCNKVYNKKVMENVPQQFLEDSFILLTTEESRRGLIGRCLAALLGSLKPSVWFHYTRDLICEPLTYQTVMTYFIEPIFKQSQQSQLGFAEFYELCKPLDNASVEIGILKAAKNAKINVSHQIQSSEVVAASLSSFSRNLRNDALCLLCSSTHKLSEKIPERIFDLIISNSASILGENEPRARADVYSAFRALLTRIKVSKSENLAKRFIEHYMFWCATSLCPGMPYRCLVTATGLVELFLETGFSVLDPQAVWHRKLIIGLVNCVTCDFNDIRKICVSVLTQAEDLPILDSIYEIMASKAFKLLSISRCGEAGARCIQLLSHRYSDRGISSRILCELREMITFASTSIESASFQTPIHGYICSLRLNPPENTDEVLELIMQAATICSPPLTHKAPEGTSENIANYCWKSIKELSLLIEDYAYAGKIRIGTGDLETHTILVRLANMLTEITHWGAFSAIPPAFIAVAKLDPKVASKILWNQIDDLMSGSRTRSVTRRSAGLPLLITSCLKVQFDENLLQSLFKMASQPLHSVNEDVDEFSILQVHGMNCLRAIITDTDLTKQSAKYLERILELCVKMFQSASWSLRNCGAMLFSSLFKRLFGVRGLPVAASVFFQKFKDLSPLLCDQLGKVTKNSEIHAVFPSLTILSKLRPASPEDMSLSPFWSPVIELLGSRSWKIRELAAHAIASMAHVNQIPDLVSEFIKSADLKNQNELHGFGLAMNELLNMLDTSRLSKLNMSSSVSLLERIILQNKCMETNTVLYKVYAQLGGNSRIISFTQLPTYEFLNPSLSVFEAEQCLVSKSVEGIDTITYVGGWSCVLFSIPVKLWTMKMAKQVLQNLHLVPADRCRILEILRDADHIDLLERVELASTFLTSKEPASVRGEALKLISKSVSEPLWDNWYKTLYEFSQDSAPVECRRSAVASLDIIISQCDKLPTNLLILLFDLLGDEDDNIRYIAVQSASKYLKLPLTAGPILEVLLVKQMDRAYLGELLSFDILNNAKRAKEKFINPEDPMFAVEKENIYRDELRSLYILLVHSGKDDNEKSKCMKASLLMSDLDFSNPLGANSCLDLVMVKAVTDYFTKDIEIYI